MAVAVVGGGLAGLTVAALLAQRGRPVIVFERGYRLGGRALAVRRDGFSVDLGAHLLLDPADSIGRLTASLSLRLPLVALPPGRICVADRQRLVRVPRSRLGLLRSPLFSPLERLHLLLVVERARRASPHHWWNESLGAWLRQYCDDTLVEHFLPLAGLPTLASATADLSAGHVLELAGAFFSSRPGVAQIVGGWGRLIDALVAVVLRHGGEIRFGQRVERLVLEDGRLQGVASPDSTFEAETVVCTLPVQRLHRLARPGSALEAELLPRARQEPISLLGLDLALGRRLRHDFALLYEPREQLVLFDPSLADPSVAPAEGQLVQALALVSARELNSAEIRRSRYAAVEWLLNRFLPGWRNALIFQRRLHFPLAVGVRHQYEQHRATLLGYRSTTTRGLYFAGDGVAARGFLAGMSIDSALAVAELILGDR